MAPGSRRGGVEALFLSSARRFAGPVRGVGVVLVSAFGLLAVPGDALPLGFALFGLMAAGAAVDCRAGFSGRTTPLALVLVAVRVVAVCVTVERTGGPANPWALNILTTAVITLQWEWPPKVAVPVTAGLLAVGLTVLDAGVLLPRVVIECVLARLGFWLLHRSSRRMDELWEHRSALARAEAMSLARHRQEREYLALLHDTASSTFLLVAVHGEDTEPEQVAAYARHDLAVLTGAAGGPTTQDSLVDLTTSLRAVVARSPLTVDLRCRGESLVPASVALAMVRAVREALTNVERHAGVRAATLSVRIGGDCVVVVLDDAGVGFHPGGVPRSCRGIRSSVVERMAAAGGGATVTSRPGEGTVVRLVWPGE